MKMRTMILYHIKYKNTNIYKWESGENLRWNGINELPGLLLSLDTRRASCLVNGSSKPFFFCKFQPKTQAKILAMGSQTEKRA